MLLGREAHINNSAVATRGTRRKDGSGGMRSTSRVSGAIIARGFTQAHTESCL